MKSATRETVVITATALLAAVLVVGVGILLELRGITVSVKTVNLIMATGPLFGILAYVCQEDLRRSSRADITFAALVSAHVWGWLTLFRHGIGINESGILLLCIPEGGLFAVIMIVVGGAKYGRWKPPHE